MTNTKSKITPADATATAAAMPPVPSFANAAFTIVEDELPPESERVGKSAANDPIVATMIVMAEAAEPTKSYRFWTPAEDAVAAITDPAEREKVYNENVRRLGNRISGHARKLRTGTKTKAGRFPSVLFETRKEHETKDANGKYTIGKLGVGVYRVKDKAPTVADTATLPAPSIPAPPAPASGTEAA